LNDLSCLNGDTPSSDGRLNWGLIVRFFSFGPFVFVPEQQLLQRADAVVRLGSRAFEILTALVERPGEVVSKDELQSRVWPSTFVEESNLKVNVAALRRALGDGTDGQQYIATVTGRGYRFTAPVSTTQRDGRPGLPARTHNLPAPHGQIVGRTEEVDAILRSLESSRLVSVVGAGGIGKTTVALAVGERLTDRYEHGVWFIDLASVSDPTLVPASIAATIGLRAQSAGVEAALAAFMRDRESLLILDNCEHLLPAVASCAGMLLAKAAKVRILATSRQPLASRGERVYRLTALGTPSRSIGLSAAEALAFPAVELFVQRAQESLSDFVLRDEDAPTVAEICQRLDGLALAIELAATRVEAFGMRELLDLLEDRFQLLKGRQTDRLRHQTLAATLDWSYGLLDENERDTLRCLAVFAGAFSLDSACAIVTDGTRSRAECIGDVASLVAKSLLATERGTAGTHYRLLDTTRRYALEKLSESGALDRLRERHAEHVLELAEQAESEWDSRPTAQWLDAYGRRIDDIRSALAWAWAGRRSPRTCVALTVAAIPFWEHLSLVEESRTSIDRVLEDAFAAVRDERDDMKLNMALGTTLLHTRGPLPAVKAAWTKALQLAETLGDADYELRCLWGLCDYNTWTGSHAAALQIAEKIRRLASDRGDLAASNNVDRQAGTALRYMGELAESRRYLERMIGRYIPPVVRSDIARFQLDPRVAARGTLANVMWLQGHPDQALALAEQQLEGARLADHAVALCNALVHTACPINLLSGNLAAAEKLLAEIETHVAEHGMAVWAAMARCLRGEWLLRCGHASGLTILRGGLDELSTLNFRMRYAAHLGAYAAGLGARGDVGAAQAAIDDAITLSQTSGEVWAIPELLRIKGDLLRLEQLDSEAHTAGELYREALVVAQAQGALSWELRAATSFAELLHGLGDCQQAASVLKPVYARFDEGFGTGDLVRARTVLEAIHKPGDIGQTFGRSANATGHESPSW
jgi:predicted ATPase/DNA-binding winged helix-turn-helix (wHTH) protein